MSFDIATKPTSSQDPESRPEYYALTLLGENGKIFLDTQTQWVGFTETEPLRELRAPRRVYAEFGEIWESFKQPYVFVHTIEEMFLFWFRGGHALVDAKIFESSFKRFLEPSVSIPNGKLGFASKEIFKEFAFRRAPTPKLRMSILKRDGRRCRICGRRPDEHGDLELHVHHVRSWARGGVTDPSNLITLCSTCHSGLDPHEDLSLFDYLEPNSEGSVVERRLAKHLAGVAEYQRVMGAIGGDDFSDR